MQSPFLSQNCVISKLHIKAAFQNILVHPSDWELLGMKRQGLYFFDMVLPFGLHSAPFLFDQFSSALKWIIQNKLHIPKVIHILNDFCGCCILDTGILFAVML